MKKDIVKYLFPDAPDAPGGGVTHTPGIPQADLDFLEVAKKVALVWPTRAEITLVYTNSTAFTTLVGNYGTVLLSRRSVGGGRTAQTQTLNNLDDEIENGVSKVKDYINGKFHDDAEAQYNRYGIIHRHERYFFPIDRQERVNALDMMIAAIAADGFGSNDFGTTFWTTMKTNYETALTAAGTTDSTVSGKVGTKTQLKKEIKKVFKSLRLVLQGNYPETYKAEYRVWGWQKEDY